MIHFLGLWVLREACAQLRIWQQNMKPDENHAPLCVNVNISGKQLSHPDLVDNIKKILKETEVDPPCVSLEITESWLMEGKGPYQDTLDKIRRLGIKLQVDDFGRGYSSFRYLQSLPVTTLKIDQLFVQRLGVDSNNSEIVRSIVGLARSLGMSVVAEGVETEIQLRKLKELGCPLIQGFYFSKPLTPLKAEQLLIKNWSNPAVALS
jgi:EAL domain-containing protein (putative c-di-GMP-specific phosphodiesterase class I)